jgi:putative zinc finger protein
VTGCDDMRTDLGAYVLGALDPDEAAAMRRHLLECPECANERDALAPLPGLLTLAGGAEAAVNEPLSLAFEERLLDAYAREHALPPPSRRRRIGGLPSRLRPRRIAVGLAALAAAAAAAFGIATLGDDDSGGGGQRAYDIAFRSVGAPGASGHANLKGGASGTTVQLWVKGLPRDKDAVYEVLCDAEAWTASAGTFRTDADGRAVVVVTTALRKNEYNAIRIVRRSHAADGRLVRRDMLAARIS